MTLTMPFPILDNIFAMFRATPKTPEADTDPEMIRDRRTFMSEMMDTNPDAFASEGDMHAMMSIFPRQF